jgi:hypothetical protein
LVVSISPDVVGVSRLFGSSVSLSVAVAAWRPTGRRERRRFERFAEVREDLPVRARFADRLDGGPELVIRGKHPVVAMPVLPRRRSGWLAMPDTPHSP